MTIRDWINNPVDFNTGLQLYKQHGTRHHHIRMVETRGDTAANKADMAYELSKLVGKDESNESAPEGPSSALSDNHYQPQFNAEAEAWKEVAREIPSFQHEQLKTSIVVSDFPAEVEALRKEAIDLKNEASFIKSQIFAGKYPDAKDRCNAAHSVLDKMDQATAIWNKIDHFKEHGKLPEDSIKVPEELSNDRATLTKRLYTLRTYISRNKNKKPETIPGYEKEIAEIELKLKQEGV